MTVPRQPGGRFDERRNTSRVFPVPAGSSGPTLDALARWRAGNAAHARWIEDGYPTLTETEHRARFGVTYKESRRKR